MIRTRSRVLRSSLAVVAGALLAGWPAAAADKPPAVAIARDGADFVITAPAYQARISGKTGFLEQMTIDGGLAVESATMDLYQWELRKIDVVQEGPAKIVTYISAGEKDKPTVDKALRLTYEVETGMLYIRTLATVGRVAGRGLRFQLGPEAQMVRSLEFKETVPVPVLQGRSPWMRVKYYFGNGATLGILNEGAGNPFNANENGGVGGFTYSRGGYVANSEYVYTLIPEAGSGKRTLGAPAMKVLEATTPAVFWQGAPVVATLQIAKKDYQKLAAVKGLRIKYVIEDAFEREAGKGDVPLDLAAGADPLEVKVPLAVPKLGWYRAYFTVNDAAGSLLEGQERLIFSVLKHQANMGESFANQIQTDYTIGLGRIRLHPRDDNLDELAKQIEQARADAAGTDVLAGWQIDGPPRGVGNDPKKFGEFCARMFERVKDGIERIEIINEPNGTLQPKEYIDTFLRPAYENIKRVSPNTKVLGPVLCGISPDQARYLDELYRLGLKDVTDELTFHPYAGNFDDGWAVESMQKILGVIAANGDSAKPIHFTEAGFGHRGWSDLPALREIIKHAVSQYAWQNAIMGIDHRHNFYYFTDIMGYYDMWLRATQLTPAAVALRTYTGFVKGQERARTLSFGSESVVRGFVYPGSARQIVLLWTAANWVPAGAPDPATTVSLTTDAKSVEYFDCFGNPLPAALKRGKVSLTVGSYPAYLVVPAGARVEPVAENWGTNLALAGLGAIAESTSEDGTSPAVGAIDGNTAGMSAWRSLTPNELPQALTVTLAGPAPVDRVGIWGYSPRGYDVEVMGADAKWQKVASRRDQTYARFRTETFKPVVTDQVRVTIVDSCTDRAEIAELQVFSPAQASGKKLDLVNWALKSNGATAKASSEMSKESVVAEQDWGAKKPRLNKVRLEGKAENAIDGKRLINNWREFFPTTWMAAPGAALPQWLEITFAGPKTITSVAVYTIAFASWTPAESGVRDWDVQVWDGKDWKTVDRVTGNAKVSKVSRLQPAMKTDRIRILVKATNDAEGTVGLMEVEAFGPRE